MRNIWILIGLLPFLGAHSQNLTRGESVAKPERDAFVLKVARNSKQSFIQQIDKTPYFVENNTLQIYPLEKVNIEVELRNDTIYSMTSVAENLNPEKTIEIEFCQTVENHEAKPTLLYVRNPFPRKLKYNIIAYFVEESQWININKFAKPKWTSFDSWNKVISSLVLKDWEFEETKPKP